MLSPEPVFRPARHAKRKHVFRTYSKEYTSSESTEHAAARVTRKRMMDAATGAAADNGGGGRRSRLDEASSR